MQDRSSICIITIGYELLGSINAEKRPQRGKLQKNEHFFIWQLDA